jgi:hypothetical protein
MSQHEDDQHTEDQYRWHMSVIEDAIAKWRQDEITASRKRQLITEENKRYYGGDRKSPVTGENISRTPRPYELPGVLASAYGIPEEAMANALYERRSANVEYRRILDEDPADHEMAYAAYAAGLVVYQEILSTAGLRPKRAEGF